MSLTATADPYAFSLWPEASAASEEEMVAWALAAGYAQPGLTTEDLSLGDLDRAWGHSDSTLAEAFSFQTYSVSKFAWHVRGLTFVIGCQLDVQRDGSRGHVQSRWPPPECHRDAGTNLPPH